MRHLPTLVLGFALWGKDHDNGAALVPSYAFFHAALEILLCFSRRSLPHLTITFCPTRQTRLAGADKSYANDWLRCVVNVGILFELPEPSGNITSHRVLLSLRAGEVAARFRWPQGL
jgi:hypothetical protein